MATINTATSVTGQLASNYIALSDAQRQYVLQSIAGSKSEVALQIQRIEKNRALDIAQQKSLATSYRVMWAHQGMTDEAIEAKLATYGLTDAMLAEKAAADTAANGNIKLGASLKLLWQTNPGSLIMMIASLLATVLIPLLSKVIKTTKELREEYEQEKSDLEQLEQQYKTNADRIQELIDLKAKGDFSEQNAEELQNLRDQNVELANEIAYRERIAELKKEQASKATVRNLFGAGSWQYWLTGLAGNPQSKMDLLSGAMETLKTQKGWLQAAYENYYKTGDYAPVEQMQNAISQTIGISVFDHDHAVIDCNSALV